MANIPLDQADISSIRLQDLGAAPSAPNATYLLLYVRSGVLSWKNSSNTEVQAQPLDADLTALAALATTGVVARTGAATYSPRTITGTANRVTVSDGDGVSGNPTLDIGNDVVTLTGAQNLSDKTLVTPVIASFANAGHTHQDAAGGGTLDAAAIGAGTLNNARVNFASPAAIGSGTPAAGTFTTLTGNAVVLAGTGGAGYFAAIAQASAPSAPSSGFRLYADSSHRLAWIGQNGFVRTFDGTGNTADRAYTLPNASGTVALTSDFASPPAIGNTAAAAITGTTITATTQFVSPNGTAGTPGIQIGTTTGVGVYSSVTNQLFFATNAAPRMVISTVVSPQVAVLGVAGSTANVGFGFGGDPNTGMYQIAADQIGFAAGGTLTLQINNGALGFFGTTPASRQTGYTTFTNLSTDRTCDANATTVEELADILGTLIVDLKTLGLIAA